MKRVEARHPAADQLAAFAQGRLDAADQAAVEQHVAECESCCQQLRALPEDTLVGKLRDGTPDLTAPAIDAFGCPPALLDHPRYRIVRRLGGGGMGVVFQAEHRLMERPVALKVVRGDLLKNAGALDRFRQEFKAAARLGHPHIVTAFDADQAGDVHFLVMELVDGVSLDRLVDRKGPLPVAHACAYVRQAAQGLQHAHEQGMVHRDIKPQNLMLTRLGQVKILDFGLARFASEGINDATIPGGASPARPALTQQGIVLGTPDYIAPEQARNSRTADIRADIYSLGCTLFFLLTGRTPFAGGSALEKLVMHFEAPPPSLTALRSEVPPELAAIVLKMLAKDPARRFQTPTEVAQALAPFGKAGARPMALATTERPAPPAAETHAGEAKPTYVIESAPTPPPAPKPRRKRKKRAAPRWLVPAVVGVAVVIVLGVVAGQRQNIGRAIERARSSLVTSPPAKAAPGSGKLGSPFSTGRGRTVMIVLPREFWYPDFDPVRRKLEGDGFRVKVIGEETGPIAPMPGGGGEPVVAELALRDTCADHGDAVVFVGGNGVRDLVGDQAGAVEARRLIDQMLAKDKLVGSICAGINVLASSGALNGRSAAKGRWLNSEFHSSGGAKWEWKAIVTDGNVITARDDKDGDAFAQALVDSLKNRR